MKNLVVVFFISFFCFSQNWKYDEAGNAFDGKYKAAFVTGEGTDFPYDKPLLVIRKFDKEEYPDFFLDGAGFFEYSDPTVLLNFNNEDEIYESMYHSFSSDGNAIFFEEFNISFYDILQKMKNGNKLYIRIQTENGKNDLEFSLSGSSKAINFVIDKDLFDKIKQESVDISEFVPPPSPPPPSEIQVVELDIEIEEELESSENDLDELEIEIEEEEKVEDFAIVESTPLFPGCKRSTVSDYNTRRQKDIQCFNNGIMQHIKKNFEYPRISKEMGVQGKVYVQFVIDKTGLVTDVKIVRGEDKYLNEAAINLIETLPKMIPANQRGEPVSVYYTIPINFVLK